MPRRLTTAEVEHLINLFTDADVKAAGAERKHWTARATEKAPRRVAVENFLMSAPLNIELTFHLMNLQMDARSYGWSQRTIDCIAEGLRRMYQ